MADFYHRKRITTHNEWVVPCRDDRGADWNQVQLALNAACREWTKKNRPNPDPDSEPPDNAIRVRPEDHAIIVYFDEEEIDF